MRVASIVVTLAVFSACDLIKFETGANDTGLPEDPCFASSDAGAGGQQVFAGGGALVAVWDGGSADFANELWLAEPTEVVIGTLHETAPGTEVSLGSPEAGVELVFALTNPYGETWRTGPANRNEDGEVHARVVRLDDDTYRVGFEDLAGVGDSDFNDACFSVRGSVSLLGG
jgi:hypothetical protein